MKWQRIKGIISKEFTRMTKDPALIFLIIIFPVLLTIAFGFSFGAIGATEDTTYKIAVINEDVNGDYSEWADYFIGNLSSHEILVVQTELSQDDAEDQLQEGQLSGLVVIPEGFGVSIYSYWLNPLNGSTWVNSSLSLQLDQGSMVVKDLIPPVIQQALTETIYGPETSSIKNPVSIGVPNLVEVEKNTTFDYFAPGLFAFATIFLIMTIAEGLAKEKEQGMMKRIYLTPTKSNEIMTGLTISNMTAAMAQTIVVFIMALIVGYSPEITFGNLFVGFIASLIFSLTCVGFGLITGVLSKNSGMATGMSFIFIMPMMFLGTFVSLGEPTIANRLMPSFYVTETFKALFLRNANPFSSIVWGNIGILSGISTFVFLLGVLAFKRFSRT
ncbi:hypothetical protein NEF87_001605 [Candidatus Lokiarchaeum ossiferum]|uniref:ABC transmembrane type-2 domain-containing protein n=1 Tax=Candidatus Lokiarchaeum ossiferum TaxID=2951803 RepID=A0ABY6HPI5_9ARCH|nr:hypothetical protein NEF87_001605 [Candidatus Lokiarchaeum sp. B-35]